MSNDKNQKHVGDDVFALALCTVGGFIGVSMIVSLFREGAAQNSTTELLLGLRTSLGLVPTLLACAGLVALGMTAWMRKSSTPLLLPLGLVLAMLAATSLVLGAFGAGGRLGGFLPGALGGIAGGIAGVLMGFAVLAGAGWLALGMPSLKRAPVGGAAGISEKEGEFGSIAAALKEDTGDGVTAAEAAALIPDGPPSVEAAPGVREFEMRMRGELPDGVKPIDEPDHDGEPETQSNVPLEASGLGTAATAGSAGPAGADLVAAEEADAPARVEGHWVREATGDEVGSDPVEVVRAIDQEHESTTEPEVAAFEDRGPIVPSWESAELDEDDEEEELEEDGFAAVELEIPLEVAAVLEEDEAAELNEEFEEEEEDVAAEYEEEEEDDLDEDAAAELDEDDEEEDDVAAEYEEEEEDDLDEDAAAELDEDDEEEDDVAAEYEEEVEDDLDEDAAAELDEDDEEEDDVAAEYEEEEEDDLDEDAAAELDEDDEEEDDVAAEYEEEEEDDLDEDAAAELDEDDEEEDDVAAEYEEEEEDDLDEDAAAELDEDDEEEDDVAAEYEEEVEDDLDEDAAAELDEDDEEEDDVAAEYEAEEEDDLDEDAAAELDEGDLAEALEPKAEVAPHFQGVAQPGLFDQDEEEPMLASVEPDPEEMAPVAAEPGDLPEVELEPVARPQAAAEPAEVEVPADPQVESAEVVAAEEPAPSRPGTEDELIFRAGALFLEEGRVAVSMLQRRFDLSFKEATRVLDDLQEIGLIGPYLDGKRRDFLMSAEEWEELNLTS